MMIKKSLLSLFFLFFILLSSSCNINFYSFYMIYGNILIRSIDVPQGEVIFISDMWQDYAHVVKNRNDDKYFVFWEEKDPVGYDILGVIMNLDGSISGDPFIVSGETENDHRMPKASYNPDDNQILVVFLYRSPGGNRDIRGRIVNHDGTIIGEDIIIADHPTDEDMPTVAYSTVSHEYMVTWDVDLDPNVDDRNIYGRRISRDGSPIGEEFPVSTAPKDQFYSEIAYNPERDQYLVVWEDFRRSTAPDSWLGKGDIYGSIVDIQGNVTVEDIPISTNDEKQYMPALEYSTISHLYFVSFNDHREDEVKDPNYWYNANIMGRMVDQEGNLHSDEFTICNAPNNQIFSSVAVDNATGTFCVVWDDGRYFAEEATYIMDIFGRFYDAFGSPMGEEFTICRLPGQQHWPIVEARGEDGEFFAVWGDGRKNPDNVEPKTYLDIYGQIFSQQKREFGIKCITKLEGSEEGLTGLRVTLSHGSLETEGRTGDDGSFYVCGFKTGQVVTLTPMTAEGYTIEPSSITVNIEGKDEEVEFVISVVFTLEQ
jgi:hypothetical protein